MKRVREIKRKRKKNAKLNAQLAGRVGGEYNVVIKKTLTPLVDHLQVVALPDSVVVWQSVVAAPHDVERGQVPARELHGAEEVVAHVRAEHGVLALAQLGRETQEDFFHGFGGDLILRKKITRG